MGGWHAWLLSRSWLVLLCGEEGRFYLLIGSSQSAEALRNEIWLREELGPRSHCRRTLFPARILKLERPHCRLQVIKSDFFASRLQSPVWIGCRGNDAGFSTSATDTQVATQKHVRQWTNSSAPRYSPRCPHCGVPLGVSRCPNVVPLLASSSWWCPSLPSYCCGVTGSLSPDGEDNLNESNLCCSHYMKSDFHDSRQDRNPICSGSVNRALEGQSQDKVGGA